MLCTLADWDGTFESAQKLPGCELMKCFIQNALYEEEVCSVAFVEDGKTAIVEVTQSNGIYRIKGRENPAETSTYGVGQLCGFAADMGAKKIILIIEDGATCDCGLGLMAALGGCFYNKDGVSFVPTGGTLCEVQEIDLSMMYPRLQGARFYGVCNTKSTMCGKDAVQDGFEDGYNHVAKLFMKMRKTDFSLEEGSGAGGGIGFTVLAGLNGTVEFRYN